MTAREKQKSINNKSKIKSNRDLKLLMSLIDPSVADSLADAASRGIGYVELSPEAEESILKKVMKKINSLYGGLANFGLRLYLLFFS